MSTSQNEIIEAVKAWVEATKDGYRDNETYQNLVDLIEDRESELEKRKLKVKFGPTDLPDHFTCFYCGLADTKVEAGGIWWCPNFTCEGPGGHSHRRNLKSYVEHPDGTHTVDPKEWASAAEEKVCSMEESPIKEATVDGLQKLRTFLASKKFGLD